MHVLYYYVHLRYTNIDNWGSNTPCLQCREYNAYLMNCSVTNFKICFKGVMIRWCGLTLVCEVLGWGWGVFKDINETDSKDKYFQN